MPRHSLWGVAVEARLVYLQVFRHDTLLDKARLQQIEVFEPDAPRGDIRDRNGQLLAYSVESFGLHADPTLIQDATAAARDICGVLGDCSAKELELFNAKLAKKLTPAGKPVRGVELRAARNMSKPFGRGRHCGAGTVQYSA